MLKDIYTKVKLIYKLLVSIGEFFINLVQGLFDFFSFLPAVMTMLMSSVANLPDIVLPFATASITVAIIMLVVGRSNTG